MQLAFRKNKERRPRVFHCLVALGLDALGLAKKKVQFPRVPSSIFPSQPLHKIIFCCEITLSQKTDFAQTFVLSRELYIFYVYAHLRKILKIEITQAKAAGFCWH